MYTMTGGQMGNCTQFYGHMYIAYMYIISPLSRSLALRVLFPTTAFVYIHRNQSSNRSTVNKEPIGKNKEPGR